MNSKPFLSNVNVIFLLGSVWIFSVWLAIWLASVISLIEEFISYENDLEGFNLSWSEKLPKQIKLIKSW